ncbi:MAG: hypothetical protein ACLFVO_25370 [Chloroflexaceae bacterium]
MRLNKISSWRGALPGRTLRAIPLLRILAGLLVVAALALGVQHAGRFAEHTQAMLAYRYPLDGQEGTLLYEARLLRAGEPLYQPLQPDRVVAAPYPPVYYLALAALERLTNPAGGHPPVTEQPIFLPGRLLSLTAMLSVAVALTLIVWRIGKNPAIGLVAACLWLAFPPVQLWSTRIKPDTLALAFTALGLLAATWYVTRSRRRWMPERDVTGNWLLVGAAVAFALAFFTKQTAVAAPAATGLTLLLVGVVEYWNAVRGGRNAQMRERNAFRPRTSVRRLLTAGELRPVLLFSGVYAGLVATTWIGLDLLTGGQYTFHVWGLHPAEWWSYGRFRKYANLILPAWPLIVLAAGSFILLVRSVFRAGGTEAEAASGAAGEGAPALLLAGCYGVLGTLTLVGAGTTGSHHNHLLEPQLALTLAGCSVVGTSLSRFWRKERPRARMRHPATYAHWLALGLLLLQLWTLRERLDWYDGEFDMRDSRDEQFVALIMSQPGEVLADDVGLLLAAGRPLRYDDPATMGPAVRTGLWDQSVLLSEIEAQRFSLILLPFNATRFDIDPSGRWSPEFIAALRRHYRTLYRDVMFSYVPREE